MDSPQSRASATDESSPAIDPSSATPVGGAGVASSSGASGLGVGLSSLASSMRQAFGQTLTAAALSASSAMSTVANTATQVLPQKQDRGARERELRA